ncbi:hypothetical protein NMY22_g11384 [Coprinellus aureogranulatus]|nr:hypothetical protein NMY22_g11384 [Coprinellus aureogranulatus]
MDASESLATHTPTPPLSSPPFIPPSNLCHPSRADINFGLSTRYPRYWRVQSHPGQRSINSVSLLGRTTTAMTEAHTRSSIIIPQVHFMIYLLEFLHPFSGSQPRRSDAGYPQKTTHIDAPTLCRHTLSSQPAQLSYTPRSPPSYGFSSGLDANPRPRPQPLEVTCECEERRVGLGWDGYGFSPSPRYTQIEGCEELNIPNLHHPQSESERGGAGGASCIQYAISFTQRSSPKLALTQGDISPTLVAIPNEYRPSSTLLTESDCLAIDATRLKVILHRRCFYRKAIWE